MNVTKTVSTIFLVPPLKIGKNKLLDNGFINAYIADKQKDIQYKDSVLLLFKPTNLETFRLFTEEQHLKHSFIEDYDYQNGYVVFVYKLDEEFKKDFELIKSGHYSQTSKKFKNLFDRKVEVKKNNKTSYVNSLQHMIFDKSAELLTHWETELQTTLPANLELWEIFDNETETLDINKILNKDERLK